MAQPAQIPEGNRLPHIYPTDFWVETVEKAVKRPVKKIVTILVKGEDGEQFERDEERVVYQDEIEFVNEEFVRWVKKGDTRSATVIKIRLLKKTDPEVWKAIEPHYNAWKKGEEIPEHGTPLENWPLIRNKRQIAELKLISIRTVEDLAGMPDAMLQNIGMGARELRDKAKAYVAAKGNEAQFAVMLTQRDEQIGKQQVQIDELTKSLENLTRNMPQKSRPKDIAKTED